MLKKLVLRIVDLLGSSLAKLLSKALDAAVLFFKWRSAAVANEARSVEIEQEEKKQAEAEQQRAEFEAAASKATKSGSVADLLSLCLAAMLSLAAGCTSSPRIDIHTTEPWEGRYSTAEDFYRATRQLDIKRGESVWVLSSSTLERVLI